MKKLLLSFMLVLLLAPTALRAQNVQNEITIGEGTYSTEFAPFRNSLKLCWTETVYPCFGGKKTINSIAYHSSSYSDPGKPTCTASVNIYLVETDWNTIPTSGTPRWPASNTLKHVYSGNNVVIGDTEWEKFEFNVNKTFEYSGEKNLLVIIHSSLESTNSEVKWYCDEASNSNKYKSGSSYPSATAGTNTKHRAQIKFGLAGDTWQDAITIEEFPYENTPVYDNLNDDYDLPGTSEDGKDVVYKFTVPEEKTTTISASVEGTNGKIAVYTEAEVKKNGITATNNIQVGGTTPDPDPDEPGAEEGGGVLFECDFDDVSDLETHFNIYDVDGDGENFKHTFNGATGNGAVTSYSFNLPVDNTPDNVILTKKSFLIKEGTTLTYDVKSAYTSYTEHYSIVISENGTTFDDVVEYDINTDEKGITYTFTEPAYVGKTVYLGFRHFGCIDQYYIEFDNIILTDGPSKSSRATATDNSIEDLVLEAGTYYIAASATSQFTVYVEDECIVKAGDVKYESMQEAVDAAGDYSTITLLKDAEGPAFNVNKYLTIELNGKTYTINNESPINLSAGFLTLQNGTIVGKDEYTNLINITGGAQLKSDFPITGKITKNIKGTEEGWGSISTPVGLVNLSAVDGLLTAEGAELYLYDEANESWRYYSNTEHPEDVSQPFDEMVAGLGYIYASKVDTDVTFSGEFDNEPVMCNLTCSSTGDLAGFNMIGNPFTYTMMKPEDYFTCNNDAILSNGFYKLGSDGSWETAHMNYYDYINPMESVMIKTNKATILTIEDKAKGSKSRKSTNGILQINVSNSQYNDVAYVSFDEGLGLDKISHLNKDVPMVYVPVDGTNYAVAMMDKNVTEVPVSFKAMTMGEYTISAKALDCEFAQMTLVDKLTGESTNLLLEDYTFMARSNDNASRFVIYLTGKDNADINSEMFIFHNNDELVINNISGNAVVRIIDIMGRPVAEYNVSGSANISTASFANGVYMIQMSDENGVKVQKVVID